MGIYDRDYYRQERGSFSLRWPHSAVGLLILINVALYLADGLLTSENHAITNALTLRVGDLTTPWRWWHFLTYGFAHESPPNFAHILFNMLGLWFLGRDVEQLYGRGEFLRVYLALILVGGLVWTLVAKLRGAPPEAGVLGASGAVVGVVLLFALNFPRRTVILFPIPIPMPAWVLGVLIVGGDLLQAIGRTDSQVAYSVHLAGAAFAFFYYRLRWSFSRLGSWFSLDRLRARPRLRVHAPPEQEENLTEEVDRILEKIHREGEASLTRKERRALENASRQYQRRRQRSGDD